MRREEDAEEAGKGIRLKHRDEKGVGVRGRERDVEGNVKTKCDPQTVVPLLHIYLI